MKSIWARRESDPGSFPRKGNVLPFDHRPITHKLLLFVICLERIINAAGEFALPIGFDDYGRH